MAAALAVLMAPVLLVIVAAFARARACLAPSTRARRADASRVLRSSRATVAFVHPDLGIGGAERLVRRAPPRAISCFCAMSYTKARRIFVRWFARDLACDVHSDAGGGQENLAEL